MKPPSPRPTAQLQAWSPFPSTAGTDTPHSNHHAAALDALDRSAAAIRSVLLIQARELHLPTDLRRGAEVVGPYSFRVEAPHRLPSHSLEGLRSFAEAHPLEVWFELDAHGSLAQELRAHYPVESHAGTIPESGHLLGRNPDSTRAEDPAELAIDELTAAVDRLPHDSVLVGVPFDPSLLLVVGSEFPSDAHPETSDFSPTDRATVVREIEQLHDFFVAWFNGTCPQSDAAFSRVELALGPTFEMIDPSGERIDRPTLMQRLREAYGCCTEEDGFAISVREPHSRRLPNGTVLTTYEEHQVRRGEATARLSTAVLSLEAAETETGVRWEHVHETWIAGKARS